MGSCYRGFLSEALKNEYQGTITVIFALQDAIFLWFKCYLYTAITLSYFRIIGTLIRTRIFVWYQKGFGLAIDALWETFIFISNHSRHLYFTRVEDKSIGTNYSWLPYVHIQNVLGKLKRKLISWMTGLCVYTITLDLTFSISLYNCV